jgi:LytS/YehU family sensor histidine kinase
VAIIAYANYFIVMPRAFKHKNFGRYLLEFGLIFAFVIAVYINYKRYQADGYTYREMYYYSTRLIVQHSISALFITIFIAMLKFARDWFELEARKREIDNEKLMVELRFLKAQVNPHFLFNTLNNLYYLAYTNSPNTTEVIAKLAQMMRYMLYDSNHPLVPLSREIEYMESYISLEQLRLNNQVSIRFQTEGDPQPVKVVPLVLITFLENAFKHGVGANRAAESWIDMSIQIQDKLCIFTVENSKLKTTESSTLEKSGIGLQNVRRRLELSYPDRHDLKVEDRDTSFYVQLRLQLA